MSIHLRSIPFSIAEIDKARNIRDLKSNSRNVDFKIKTNMTNMDLMENILSNSLLGFKSKRMLNKFSESGMMVFYKEFDDKINIAMLGNFDLKYSVMFLNNLTREYFQKTNQMYLYEEIILEDEETNKIIDEPKKTVTTNVEKPKKKIIKPKAEVQVKKQIISTNMKDKKIIEEIMKESYLGFNSEKERDKFINQGVVGLSKTDDETYNVLFMGEYDKSECEQFVEILKDEYALKIQEITYEKVLEKIKQENYSLESEIVDENDAIVLTINM